jgi:transposase
MCESRAPARMRHSWEARCRMVRLMLDGVAPVDAARICGASRATAYRLLARFSAGGWDALRDRPPIAKHCPWRLSVAAEQQILELRARTGWGPARLAALLGRPPSTIWRVLKRGGVSRRVAQPRPDACRYEYAEPGGLIHLDIKRLGRFWQPGKRVLGAEVGNRSRYAGWQYLHVMIDDHSRLAPPSCCRQRVPPTADERSTSTSPGSPSAVSTPSACSPTTAMAIAPTPLPTQPEAPDSSIYEHDHDALKRTGKLRP